MNKSAVALAADSAVTIGSQRGQKIFNTVNKLFALSKHRPVAVMVYGSAQIMRAPWETVIKVYRRQLKRRAFEHLEDYGADFLRFVAANRELFPAKDQRSYFEGLVVAFYDCINDEIQKEVRRRLEEEDKITIEETKAIIAAIIRKHFEELKGRKNLPGFTDDFGKALVRRYSRSVTKIRRHFFQKLPLSRADLTALEQMTRWLFIRDSFRFEAKSGVVVAGFGERDMYPRLQEFIVEGVIQNKLRFRRSRHVRIGHDTDASITPFAQSEVVKGFIDGMDPGMENLVNKFLDEVFLNYPGVLLNHVPNLDASKKQQIIDKMRGASGLILKKFREAFEKFRKNSLVDPIVSTVGVLPKDELAAMAESLVNLTSFKRRFSLDAETVGGPVDVAVISKGDGLIWIKRKHYFKPELNPHFLTNYVDTD